MQDLFFDVDVLNEDLGIVSGKKWVSLGNSSWPNNPTYYLYDTDELLMFNINFRTWGPFEYRKDLVRMTVTVRPKGQSSSLVRASVQYNLQAIEDREMYQGFFNTMDKSLFLTTQMH
ncbi:MAG: hypothetical protein ACOC95_03965 [Planctomycetota bacterium]